MTDKGHLGISLQIMSRRNMQLGQGVGDHRSPGVAGSCIAWCVMAALQMAGCVKGIYVNANA